MIKQARVQVYWNSTRKIYSIRYKGKVRLRSENLYLQNCEFKVNQNARDKVVLNKRKSVHAYIVGEMCNATHLTFSADERFFYNPYTMKHFSTIHGKQLNKTDFVLLTTREGKPVCYYKKDGI